MDGITDIAECAAERAGPGGGGDTEDRRLKALCNEFEGILLGVLLKEGLIAESMADEEESSSGVALLESAVEHAAQDMGRQGVLRLGEMMYASLTGKDTN